MTNISNTQDTIDSRDVIARIEELESYADDDIIDGPQIADELESLKAFAEEGEESSDWEYGEQLIRYSHFRDYAIETAMDGGMVDDTATWPMTCIDWDMAARELKHDYMSVDFAGVEYYIRAS